jgi:hypothetical protein
VEGMILMDSVQKVTNFINLWGQLQLINFVELAAAREALTLSQHFMECEVSLLCSQELSTCTYPETGQSSPQHSILSLQDPS